MSAETSVRLWIGLFVIWLAAAAGSFALLDEGSTMLLGWAALALVAIATLLRPVEYAGAVAALATSVGYSGLQLARTVYANDLGDANYLPLVALGFGVFAATTFIAGAVSRSVERVQTEIDQRQRTIDELTLQDPLTGVWKSSHAQRMLIEEIERARRYQRALTLVLVRPEEWAEGIDTSTPETRELLADMGALLRANARNVDKVIQYRDGIFAVLLPETALNGAHVVAEKMCKALAERSNLTIRAGVAEFPHDAVTPEGLLQEAEQALEFASTARIQVASRALLS